MKRKIIWKPWIDPLVAEDKDKQVIEFDEEPPEYDDPYNKLEKNLLNEIKSHKPEAPGVPIGPVIVSPMGVIPLNEHNLPSKVFNFWMMHTNFNIGSDEMDALENVPGVESIDLFSPYRCRISFGVAFDVEEVKDEIERVFLSEVEAPKKVAQETTALDRIKQQLKSKYPYWAIFVLSDGQIDYTTGDTKDSVKEKIAAYPSQPARILTSWELNGNEQTTQSV